MRDADASTDRGGVVVGNLIKGQYEIVNILGHGGFGSVYKVKDKKSNKHFAMKIEFEKPKDEAGVEVEVNTLQLLQTNCHFLRYVDHGQLNDNAFMVMQLAGKNLAELRKWCPKKMFTKSTSVRLAEQTMDAIEAMHAAGFLHRDVKAANYATGASEKDKTIYLLDFGLVRRFKTPDGTLMVPRNKAGFKGTIKYAAINCHKLLDLGRHDDLCSWFYMVYEFTNGELPWTKQNDRAKVLLLKETSKEKLMAGVEKEIGEIYDTVLRLTYADEPPYHRFRSLLTQVMQRLNARSNEPFDWDIGGAYCQATKTVCEHPYKKHIKSKKKVIKENPTLLPAT